MRKLLYILTCIVCLSSCHEDLSIQPKGEISEGAVWNDANLMQAFVNNIYSYMGTGIPNELMLMSLSDEGYFTHGWSTPVVVEGNMTPDNLGPFGGANQFKQYHWDNNYKGIRVCNMFLENVVGSSVTNKEMLDQLKGEVFFLRAFMYHNLLKVYGGVPLISKTFGLQDDFVVPRNTFAECVKFIADNCDSAAALLPLVPDPSDIGRATKGAALALKARTFLYAASDLYNTSWASGYSHPELISNTGADRAALWKAAKDAAKAVIDLNAYDLYKKEPSPADSIAKNLADIFLVKNNEEIIMAKYYIKESRSQALRNYGPNGFLGWGSNVPSADLADAFEMNDGTPFSWTDPAQAAAPYSNRDPRFYAFIMYDGARFQPRPDVTSSIDPTGIVETAESIEYWNASSGRIESRTGLDTRQGPVYNWNGTYTGYYMRKFLDDKVKLAEEVQDAPWIYMRYAEVLLNYAEACIGLGEEAEARQVMNLIRHRAGMPDVPPDESGEALLARYRNERRIELAFEEHRFFDARRWMIAPDVFGRDLTGVKIERKLNADHVTHTSVFTPGIVIQNRAWKNRNYFLPIPQSEILKSSALVQNPEY